MQIVTVNIFSMSTVLPSPSPARRLWAPCGDSLLLCCWRSQDQCPCPFALSTLHCHRPQLGTAPSPEALELEPLAPVALEPPSPEALELQWAALPRTWQAVADLVVQRAAHTRTWQAVADLVVQRAAHTRNDSCLTPAAFFLHDRLWLTWRYRGLRIPAHDRLWPTWLYRGLRIPVHDRLWLTNLLHLNYSGLRSSIHDRLCD